MILKAFFCLPLLFFLTSAKTKTEEGYTTHWGPRKSPLNPHPPKVYEINLDLPYEERWKNVLTAHKEQIDHFRKKIIVKYLPTKWIDFFSYPLAKRYNFEYAEEIKAMADILEIPFTELFMLNFMYESAALCSSLVMEDPSHNLILARTLDFGLSSTIAPLVFHGKYYKNGKLLYETVDVAGFLGLVTGIKPNQYAFSINEYFTKDEIPVLKQAQLLFRYGKQIYNGKLPPPYIVRKAFEEAENYEELVRILLDTETTSRVHYIVAGPNKGQGAVITKALDVIEVFETLDPENGRWFLAQTNYVKTKDDPKGDNRRTAETERLDDLGRKRVSHESIMDNIMNLYPTFNAHTIHTTLMQPNNNYINTTIWY